MEEIWKPINGYGGHYEVSSLGRVRVKDRYIQKSHKCGRTVTFFYKSRMLALSTADKYGHKNVCLGVDGKTYTVLVHRAVLEAFVGPRPAGMECCHNDGDGSNNRLENLRWDTHAANNKDRLIHGTYRRGEDHHCAKITKEIAQQIREDHRSCAKLGAKYGLHPSTINRIKRNVLWS